MARFFCQNPILKIKKQFRIDFIHINNIIFDIIKVWFQKLKILAIKIIKIENRWNINEIGIIEGQGENKLVVRNVKKYFIQKK
jgi:hypothetical protein